MKRNRLRKSFRTPVKLLFLGALIVAFTSSGCGKCGGLGSRGPHPDAPYGAADDTLTIVSGAYVSLEYVYDCMDGEQVRSFYHSASECADYQYSETRTPCDTSQVTF